MQCHCYARGYNRLMLKTTIATLLLLAIGFGLAACRPLATPVAPVAPTASGVPAQPSATLPPTESAATPSPVPAAVSTALDYGDLAAVYAARFVTTDTVAYLDQGDLFLYSLARQTARRITSGGNTTSFDWSPAQARLVVAENGRPLLLDLTGKLSADLGVQPAASAAQFQGAGCTAEGYHTTESINLLEHVSWVAWSPDQGAIVFAADVYEGNRLCYSTIGVVTGPRYEARVLGTIVRYLARPRFVGAAALMLEHYTGGGQRTFDVVDVDSGKTLFSTTAWGSYPVVSPGGRRLAVRAGFGTDTLDVFDVAARQVIYHHVFTGTSLEIGAWSDSGRYLSFFERSATASALDQPAQTTVLDVDTQQPWRVQEPAVWPTWTWIPGANQLLAFTPNDNHVTVAAIDPAGQTVMTVETVQNTKYLWPASWSHSSRYLALFATGPEGEGEQGIPVWDERAQRFLAPCYQVPAASGQTSFIYQDWSADDRWMLVVQFNGPLAPATTTVLDLLALDPTTGERQVIAGSRAVRP
jgi:hypothetical protein